MTLIPPSGITASSHLNSPVSQDNANDGAGPRRHPSSRAATPSADLPQWASALTKPSSLPSQAHIGRQAYEVDADTPPVVGDFLSITIQNNNYPSREVLEARAANHMKHRDAQRYILNSTLKGLNDPDSNVFKQTAWMGHLERGLWKDETRFAGHDRMQLAAEALGEPPQPGSPFDGERGLRLSERASGPFSMMLSGTAGPFTQEQARAGFELAQSGQVLAGRLKIAERIEFRKKNRVDANRSGTAWTSPGGIDLSRDVGTRVRDELGLPVMGGTSGSSSDATLATRFAAERAQQSWAAPGLSESEGCKAIADLSYHYFHAEESNPPHSMARILNAVHADAGRETKANVDALDVFSHSYVEIHAAVRLTLDGAPASDEPSLRQASEESARLLRDAQADD